MYLTKILKNLFLLTLPCLIWAQVANAEFTAATASGGVCPYDLKPEGQPDSVCAGGGVCPYDQICTGDIVLISMDTNFDSWDKTFIMTSVYVARDASDPDKGYSLVRSHDQTFKGFYYRVKPGKTYYFKAEYLYNNYHGSKMRRATEYFYYKSRGDALNPVGSAREGMISTSEAKAIGLPPIPKCTSMKSPGQFCTNQVVHVFWNNNRGGGKDVLDVDLYINGQFVKNENGDNFKDFYYVLPEPNSQDRHVAVNFQVKWTVWNYEAWTSHYENSQSLLSTYTPGWAYACKPTDSWEECQYHPKETNHPQ